MNRTTKTPTVFLDHLIKRESIRYVPPKSRTDTKASQTLGGSDDRLLRYTDILQDDVMKIRKRRSQDL